jgi:hypothetical protein
MIKKSTVRVWPKKSPNAFQSLSKRSDPESPPPGFDMAVVAIQFTLRRMIYGKGFALFSFSKLRSL